MPGGSLIVMDAPPEQEDCGRFVRIAGEWRAFGLNTPEVLAQDLERGFLLLAISGEQLYLDALDADTVERLYADALAALVVIQACGPTAGLPDYDGAFLWRELGIFREWLLERHLGLVLSDAESAMLDAAFEYLIGSALDQPRVCVHRDYHSRNLMVFPGHNPGILDFQDAVVGPVTYDLVSLLRDCYVAWPRDRVEEWAMGYYHWPSSPGCWGRSTRAPSWPGSISWGSSATSRPAASSPASTAATASRGTWRTSRAPWVMWWRWRRATRPWRDWGASSASGSCPNLRDAEQKTPPERGLSILPRVA